MIFEAQMRQLGEPSDRCSLNANIHEGAVVIRTSASSTLTPGDRLTVVNRVSVAGKPAEDVIAVLRQIEPTAMVPVTLDREGELLDLEVPCTNARTTTEPIVNALNLAGRGKFDECVEVLARMSDLDTRGAMLKAQCAAVSRNAKKHHVPVLILQAMSMAIEDARWAPVMRAEVIKQLRAVEGTITQALGASRYQALVADTRAWPGGEALYETSGPDWALFRRNAEVALRGRLLDPESARIEWPYGFLLGSWKPLFSKRLDGYWTCGMINARNRMGGYTGSSPFVVVLDPNGIVQFADLGKSDDFDVVTAQCNNSVKLLPPAPAELSAVGNAPAATTLSVADELQKLLDLKNSGALTEAEFQAAKQRLLGTSP